jgi:hypothetical protein
MRTRDPQNQVAKTRRVVKDGEPTPVETVVLVCLGISSVDTEIDANGRMSLTRLKPYCSPGNRYFDNVTAVVQHLTICRG